MNFIVKGEILISFIFLIPEKIKKMDKNIFQKRENFIADLLDGWSGDIDDIEDLLRKAMEFADAHPSWIPAKENLPNVRETVMIRSSGYNEPLKGYQEEDGSWLAVDDDDYWNNITHWLPLPSIEDLKKKTK